MYKNRKQRRTTKSFFFLERKGHDIDVEPAVEEAVGVTTKDHLDYKNDDNNVVISDDYKH